MPALDALPESRQKLVASVSSSQLLGKSDAASLLGVSPRTVDNLRLRGELRAVKIGSRVLFEPYELDRFIQAQKETLTCSIATNMEGHHEESI